MSADPLLGEIAQSATEGRELEAPDAETVGWIYYDLAGVEPPLERWARKAHEDQARRYRSGVNEFNAADHLAEVRAEFSKRFEGAKGFDRVRVDINGNVSEYDTEYQEFYVDAFSPGSYLSYEALGQTFKIRMTNAADAYVWSVPAEEARKIVKRLGSYRRVKVSAHLKLKNAAPLANGGRIDAEIVSYTIYSSKGIPLGTVELGGI